MNNKVIIILFILFVLIVFFSSLQTASQAQHVKIPVTTIVNQATPTPTVMQIALPTPTLIPLQHRSINRFGEGGDE